MAFGTNGLDAHSQRQELEHGASSSEEAVQYEALIRFALKNMHHSNFAASYQDQLSSLSQVLKQYITDDIASRRPLLRAMRDHILVSLSTAASTVNQQHMIDSQSHTIDSCTSSAQGFDNTASEDATLNIVEGARDTETGTGTETEIEVDTKSDHGSTGADKGSASEEESAKSLLGTATTATFGEHEEHESVCGYEYDDYLREIALRSLDSFISVQVIGARAKASAFFDKLVRDTRWSRVALVAGSSVAEACFLAVNAWGMTKTLTVIDVGPSCSGQTVAARLAAQTQTHVRYAPLAAAYKMMSQVDVVVMGAREVCTNGNVITDAGGAVIAQAAQDAGVAVVIAAQATKMTERGVTNWFAFDTDGDVIKAREIQAIVTELDTASWRPTCVPDMLKRMAT